MADETQQATTSRTRQRASCARAASAQPPARRRRRRSASWSSPARRDRAVHRCSRQRRPATAGPFRSSVPLAQRNRRASRRGRRRAGPQRDPAGRLAAAHRAGADPRVPRARRRAGRRRPTRSSTCSRPDFHRQMDWLDEHGYEAVTLEQVEDAWYEGGTLPPKPVVLSFDDGYRPQFTFALPELRTHGWAGRAQPEGGRLGPLREQRQGDDRRRLGARRAHDRPLST